MARPDHPLARGPVGREQARRQTWHAGPSAVGTDGVVSAMLRKLGVPEQNQRIVTLWS